MKTGDVIDGGSAPSGIWRRGFPGTVDGMITALDRFGTLPLEVVMEPANPAGAGWISG